MRRTIPAITIATVLLVVLGVGASAQEGSAGPVASSVPSEANTTTVVYADSDWCALFTDDGALMPIDECERRVRSLLGDPGERSVPESLLPLVIFLDPPDPDVRRITVKGRGSRSSKPFTIPAGASYRVMVEAKGCGPSLWARLRDADYVAPSGALDTFGIAIGGRGGYVWNPGEGEYRVNVVSTRKAKQRPCTWRFTFEPVMAADYVDLEGYVNNVVLPVPEE